MVVSSPSSRALGLLLLVVLAGCSGEGDREPLVVFAASSLTEPFEALAEAFEAAHPDVDVQTTFAGSQVLRLQIEQGAPAQVFASADPSHLEALHAAGAADAPLPFAETGLALIVPPDSPIERFDQLEEAERLVIGAPTVPVGRYTRALFERLEETHGATFADAVRSHVVSEESNVRLVRAKVALGEADAAFVYRTDVGDARSVALPPALAVRARYAIATTEGSDLATAFVAFVRSPAGKAILEAHGFEAPGGGVKRSPTIAFGALLAAALVGLLLLPIAALVLSTSPADVSAGLADPSFAPALWLSLRTTLVAVAVTLLAGTPLAWWLATSRSRLASVVAVLVDLPIVIPPAVVGVALLQTFGRQGLFGPALESVGVAIPFTTTAVVLAQVVVSAPFYVQAATSAFAAIDPDLTIVARSLGASRAATFARVAVPIAAPGLIGGASLAWARALGEFGATLLFAGNMSGRTQTMPLAIFTALEEDVQLAVLFSLVLVALGALLLVALRWLPGRRRRAS